MNEGDRIKTRLEWYGNYIMEQPSVPPPLRIFELKTGPDMKGAAIFINSLAIIILTIAYIIHLFRFHI